MKKLWALWIGTSALVWGYAADTDFTEKFEKQSVYGKWIDIDRGKIIEVNSKTTFSFERLDNDLIILKEGQNKNYLKRIGALKTKITGRIVEDRGGKRFDPVPNQKVFLVNIHDSSIAATVMTNSRGFFVDESLPSGEYRLSVSKEKMGLSIPVTLKHAHESLGTFILQKAKAANFKSELLIDDTYIISNAKRYRATVRIRNYGIKKGRVCYSASMKDKDLRSLGFVPSCREVKAGGAIDLPIYLSFNPIKINSLQKELTIKLTESSGRTMTESHPFVVYQNYFNLKIKTPLKSIKGYVVLPGQGVTPIDIKKGYVALPKLSDKEYKLILANADPKEKTAYEVDIGAEEKLSRGMKNGASKSKRGKRSQKRRNNLFRLRQSIGRYPDIGDIAIYSFTIPDAIVMNEDDAAIKVRFSQKDSMGDTIPYVATISDGTLAKVSYKNGYLNVVPFKNVSGITTIRLTNSKGYGSKKEKLFTLKIRQINDKPKILSKPIIKAVEGKRYSYYLKAYDTESRYLNKWASKLPKWLKFDSKKSLLSGVPKAWDEGRHEVTLSVSDGEADVSQSFTITVTALARAPKLTDLSFETDEDTTLSATLKAKTHKPANVVYTLVKGAQNGTVTLSKSGHFSYIPKADFYGNDSFTFKATSNGKSTVSSADITVKNINDAPKAHSIDIKDVGGGPLRLEWMKLADVEDVDGDEVKLSIERATKLGKLHLSEENELVYTPFADIKGDDIAYLSLSDGNGGTVSITLNLQGVERHLTPRVLQTGQRVIYQPYDDAIYKKNLPRRYEWDLNRTVIKDMTQELSWYVGENPVKQSYANAESFCRDLRSGKSSGWRLPTIEELVMLSNKGKTAPAVDKIFKNIKSDYYWSQTPYAAKEGYRWVLYFFDGGDYYREDTDNHYAICVKEGVTFLDRAKIASAQVEKALHNTQKSLDTAKRAKEAPQSVRFERNEEKGLVWDKEAELIWYDGKALEASTWVAAIKTCEQLKFGGFDDWRLPNFNELYLITDHTQKGSAIHASFKEFSKGPYWSSTSSDYDHDRAWGISFDHGGDFTFDKAEQIHLRCVKDQ